MLNRDYKEMLSALCDQEVEFLLVGAYALAAHGIPRATGDLDIWIRPVPGNAERAWQAVALFGAPMDELHVDDFTQPGTVFQIGVAPRRIDLLTGIDGVEFDAAWSSRVEVEIEGLLVPIIGREDLIRNKKASGRPQDLADVARLEGDQG